MVLTRRLTRYQAKRGPLSPLSSLAIRVRDDAEVRALEEGVRKWGVGAWQKILTDNKPIFISTRTGVDLKDKWVNIQKFANRN